MSLKSKLNRMKKHIVRDAAETKEQEHLQEKIEPLFFEPNEQSQQEIPFLKEWESFGARPYYHEGEYIFIREKVYPLTYKHGRYQFADLFKVKEEWEKSLNKHKHPLSMMNKEVGEFFFFDTETTGLHGSGTQVFLLGTAQVTEKHVIVKQYFLPGPNAEGLLYTAFLNDVKNFTTSINYNGKSFDWPQVKSRHTFVRGQAPSMPAFGHFDLYHASRRLFKHTMDSVKLVNVEKTHLELERTDDVPGHLAPIIYFDFIERRDPEGVLQVMKHNERDILSLITLYTHISRLVLDEANQKDDQTVLEVAKWFESAGNHAAARSALKKSLLSKKEEISIDAAFRLAMQYKRTKLFQEAIPLFEQTRLSASAGIRSVEAAVELAKIYEHQLKDVKKAAFVTEWALAREKDARKKSHLEHRLFRLHKKLSKFIENEQSLVVTHLKTK